MSSCCAAKNKYKIRIKTGNQIKAGTKGRVSVTLYQGLERTKEHRLTNKCGNKFNKGDLSVFHISSNLNLETIEKIEVLQTGQQNWYVDWIEVFNKSSRGIFIFPIRRWIVPNRGCCIYHMDTSLPQDDKQRDFRNWELEEKRKMYELEVKYDGLPPQVKTLPEEENFKESYLFSIGIRAAMLKIDSGVQQVFKKKWAKIHDLETVYDGIFGKPEGLSNWRDDVAFGAQRICGLNSNLIRVCTRIPDNFGVTEEMIAPFLGKISLTKAMEAKRLFYIDLKILDGMKYGKSDNPLTCPFALFFLDDNKDLRPVAIQLFQRGSNNPVFLPTDDAWEMAKLWYNLADSSYHQSVTHLGSTHLLMESIAVVTNRQLSPSHPINKLLAPHKLYLMAINAFALKMLINPGGWVDRAMSIGTKGMFAIIEKSLRNWRLDVEGNLPADLESRGFVDESILPCYHFRNDALLLFHAIKRYVTSYVSLYYDHPDKVEGDSEIQKWGSELANGIKIQGIPRNGCFKTKDDIILVATAVIYQCSVGHAAANFQQYDEYGFPGKYPAFLRGKPPTNRQEKFSDDDLIKCLPDEHTTFETMTITKILSEKGTNSLGDFEIDYIHDDAAEEIVKEFRKDLADISSKITEREKTRKPSYPWLKPEHIPNAISI